MEFNLIATCAFGLEKILKNELIELGYDDFKVENGRVHFKGDEMDIAICNIHLRTAERVLINLKEFKALTFDQLFEETKSIDFGELIPIDGKMHIIGKSVRSKLYSVPDCQSIVKKAVVESMKRTYNMNTFSETGPVYKIEIGILKDIATLTVDTSGVGLHKRGYREHSGAAPLKETLAAALVYIAGYEGKRTLIDPFCGSGTILIEAAMILKNIAPNADRTFVSETWPSFPKDIYDQVREGAKRQIKDTEIMLYGYDLDSYVISTAKNNAKKAGVFSNIFFEQKNYMNLNIKEDNVMIITNPPYGERMGDIKTIERLINRLGREKAKKIDDEYFILSPHTGFERIFGFKADKNRKLYNGRIQTYYYQYFANKRGN